MRNKNFLRIGMVICAFLMSFTINAQDEEPETVYVVVSKHHRNLNSDGKDWKATEQEYFDKVVNKNEFIIHSEVLNHYYTDDSTEFLFITIYKNWNDIEEASQRNEELLAEAWPNEKDRDAFLDKLESFYTPEHSDEIYKSYSEIKNFKTQSFDPMVVYIRNSRLNLRGEDGKGFLDYNEKVTMKNRFIKGYYTCSHSYGSDSTDFLETYYYNSLSDLEAANKETEALVNIAWPNAKDKEAFSKDYNKYFTGKHSDYIYKNVPSLSK